MTCPSCAADLADLTMVRNLSICPSCQRTIAVEGDICRLATAADTVVLEPTEIGNLQQVRNRPKRAPRAR